MTIGILGLQGCCVPHERHFAKLGAATTRVLTAADLTAVDGLVIPGGESTSQIKAAGNGLWAALGDFSEDHGVWGVCAGCILIAEAVRDPSQASLAILDIDVTRNAYGSQNDSFIVDLDLELDKPCRLSGIFIRAPKIARVGTDLKVLASVNGDPVMVESGRHLGTTFHPELTDASECHQYFLDKLGRRQR